MLWKMAKNKQSNVIANVKMLNIGFINEHIINLGIGAGRGLFSIAIFHIARYANILIRFALPISTPRFKSIIFYLYSPKFELILKKNAKFSSAGGQTPNSHIGFCSFCFEQFFLDCSDANLMMLTIDVG